MVVFDVVIKFTDGETLVINRVESYMVKDNGMIELVKNGYKQFFNRNNVKYIGRTFDIGE